MKNIFRISFLLTILLMLAVQTQAQKPEVQVILADSEQLISYPMSVMSIIENKCYGCHSPNARNEKSREAMQWINLQSMDMVDLMAKMDAILEVLEKGEMPPAKMLERYPNMKLTEEEASTLKAWAEATIKSLDE